MDEDAFKKSFLNKSVFKNQAVLDFSYVTEKLFFRDEAINTLLFFYKRILDEKEIPAINYLILGIEGVGKTCTARWFGRNFKKVAMEKDVNLLVEYQHIFQYVLLRKLIKLASFLLYSILFYSDKTQQQNISNCYTNSTLE